MAAVGYTSGDPRKLNRAGYTKGDVVAADATGTLTPVPLGADTEVFTADSAEPEGVEWAPGGSGSGGTPSNTVVAETAYGQSAAAGSAGPYSRGDHTHGSPSLTNTPPATTLGVGQSAVLGSATAPARADHVHPVAGSGLPTTSAVGDSVAQGAATTFARSDHAHGREGFGAVTAQTSFGQASSNGAAVTVSRSDHTHGTPSAPSIPTAATTVAAETGYGASTAVGVATAYAREDHTHGSPSLGTSGTTAAAGNDARIVNAIQQTLLDGKGDLVAASAADTPARHAAGTDGQFLRANSATGTGLEWDTATAADVGADPSGTAAAAVAVHNADTTAVHGIANTANLILEGDPRLTDARVPTAHAASHEDGGTDEITVAESQVTGLSAALAGKQPLDADLTAIAALTPSNDDVVQRKAGAWTNRTPAQLKADLALTKSDVGLANVDNTSDAGKPISTATQAALDAKQPLDSDLTAIAGLTPTNDDFIQRKAGAWTNRTATQVRADVVPADSVTNTMLADMAANTIKGNNTGGAADPADLTVSQVLALLNISRDTQTWSRDGDATVTAGALRWYNRTGKTLTIHGAWVAAGTAPAGASLIVDVNKNGTTIFTTQANRPTIAAGSNGGTLATPDVTSLADGDYLTVDIDQIGSGTAGADVTVGVVVS